MINIDSRIVRELKGDELKLLSILTDYSNKERICWPSVKTLATDCKWSQGKVNRIKTDLISKGLIDSKPRYKPNDPGQTSNLYTIITPQVQNYTPPLNLKGGGVQNCIGGTSKNEGGPDTKSEGGPPSPVDDEVLPIEVLPNQELETEELNKEERERHRLFFNRGLVYKCLIDSVYPSLEKYADYYLGFGDFSDHLQEEIETADPTTKTLLKKIWGAAEKLIDALGAINRPRPRFKDYEVVREDRSPDAREEAELQIEAYADYCRLSKTFVTTDADKLPEKLIQCDWVLKLHEYLRPSIEKWNYDPVYDEDLLSQWLIELYYWELIYDGYKCKRQENRIVYGLEEYRKVNSQPIRGKQYPNPGKVA